MKQMTLKIFELENNPKFGSISTRQFYFFLLIFTVTQSWKHYSGSSNRRQQFYLFSIWICPPMVVIRFFSCLSLS